VLYAAGAAGPDTPGAARAGAAPVAASNPAVNAAAVRILFGLRTGSSSRRIGVPSFARRELEQRFVRYKPDLCGAEIRYEWFDSITRSG
jgi:hypothetical protein